LLDVTNCGVSTFY